MTWKEVLKKKLNILFFNCLVTMLRFILRYSGRISFSYAQEFNSFASVSHHPDLAAVLALIGNPDNQAAFS